jgi:polysaccharide pyruvyl transferase WcaK-like protein
LGGGDVVHQSYIKQINNLKIPIIAASVTITKQSDLNSLSIFKKIFVRDLRSLDIARQYHNDVSYLPDFTFILTANPINGRQLIKGSFKEVDNKIITFCLNSYLSFNETISLSRDVVLFNRLVEELSRLCENTTADCLFLPFSTKLPWDDRAISSWIANRCKKTYDKNHVFYQNLSVQDVLDIISASNLIVSTRLHSSIFSTIAAVSFIDIVHHDKNLGFIETTGLLDWTTSFWQYDAIKVKDLVDEFLKAEVPNKKLQNFTDICREKLIDASAYILR